MKQKSNQATFQKTEDVSLGIFSGSLFAMATSVLIAAFVSLVYFRTGFLIPLECIRVDFVPFRIAFRAAIVASLRQSIFLVRDALVERLHAGREIFIRFNDPLQI